MKKSEWFIKDPTVRKVRNRGWRPCHLPIAILGLYQDGYTRSQASGYIFTRRVMESEDFLAPTRTSKLLNKG